MSSSSIPTRSRACSRWRAVSATAQFQPRWFAICWPIPAWHVDAQQLRSQGLTPDSLIDPSPVQSLQEFIVHRLRETHDIVHVLIGFGTDPTGELGLQAFNLAQNRSPLAVMLIFRRHAQQSSE